MVATPEHATSNPHSAEGGGQNLSAALDAAPAAVVKPAKRNAALVDLVTEAAELARHLLDAGPCPECHEGECEACDGSGIQRAVLIASGREVACESCQGTGERPHAVDCRLATFQARAQAALGGGQ